MCIYIYNGILAIKNNEIIPSATAWMDLEIIILSKVWKRWISCDITYMKSKIWPKWTHLQTRNRFTHTQRTDLWLPRGGVGDGWTGSWGLAAANYTGWINSKVLYSTENYIQQPVINHNRKEYEKEHNTYNWITLPYSRNQHIVKSLSHVQLLVTPWTTQSMEFSRPEYQSG